MMAKNAAPRARIPASQFQPSIHYLCAFGTLFSLAVPEKGAENGQYLVGSQGFNTWKMPRPVPSIWHDRITVLSIIPEHTQ